MNLNKEKIIYSVLSVFIFISIILTLKTQENFFMFLNVALVGIIFTVIILNYEWIIYLFIIFLSLLNYYFTFNLNITSKFGLLLDYFILLMFAKTIYKIIKYKLNFKTCPIILLALFSVIGILSLCVSDNIIGIKNFYCDYLRYFMIYISVLYSNVKKKEFNIILRITSIFIVFQAFIVLYQSNHMVVIPGTSGVSSSGFVLQDFFSGLLGFKSTSELGFLIILNLIYIVYLYFNKKTSIIWVISAFVLSLLTVIFNETKIVFVLLPTILIILNIKRIRLKSILISIVALILFISSYKYVTELYPEQKSMLSSKEKLIEYIDMNYAGSGISRMNGVFVATNEIGTNFYSEIVGMGPGSSSKNINGKYDFSIFYFPNTIYDYGLGGFLLLIIFFILHLKYSNRLIKTKQSFNVILGEVGVALFIIIIFSGIYSRSMLKCNFAIIAWVIEAIIAKKYFKYK